MKHIQFYTILVSFISLSSGCSSTSNTHEISEEDKLEIESLKKNIPLILADEGWEAYEKLFSDNYQNWSMVGNRVRQRDEFLPLVKEWYDAGNRAIGSEVESVGFIPLGEDKVLYLSKQRESFLDQDTGQETIRDISFVSVFVKERGEWKVDFSAFMDVPK
ncbi:MAG: hypothetical protein HRT61_23500 [Ekhidna sp.]|nr:hypothetical protein [Ekhidna sp.]